MLKVVPVTRPTFRAPKLHPSYWRVRRAIQGKRRPKPTAGELRVREIRRQMARRERVNNIGSFGDVDYGR